MQKFGTFAKSSKRRGNARSGFDYAHAWPADLTDEEIVARLIALNHDRAAEERRGITRYLRPDFQNPTGKKQSTIPLPLREGQGEGSASAASKKGKPLKQTWPKALSEQASAVQTALIALPAGATAKDVAKTFGRVTKPREERIDEIRETLEALGKARELAGGRYIAV